MASINLGQCACCGCCACPCGWRVLFDGQPLTGQLEVWATHDGTLIDYSTNEPLPAPTTAVVNWPNYVEPTFSGCNNNNKLNVSFNLEAYIAAAGASGSFQVNLDVENGDCNDPLPAAVTSIDKLSGDFFISLLGSNIEVTLSCGGCCCNDTDPSLTKTYKQCRESGGSWNCGEPCASENADCRCCTATEFKYLCVETVFETKDYVPFGGGYCADSNSESGCAATDPFIGTEGECTGPGRYWVEPCGDPGDAPTDGGGGVIAVDLGLLFCFKEGVGPLWSPPTPPPDAGYILNVNCGGGGILPECPCQQLSGLFQYTRFRLVEDCESCAQPPPPGFEPSCNNVGTYGINCVPLDEVSLGTYGFACGCAAAADVNPCLDNPLP